MSPRIRLAQVVFASLSILLSSCSKGASPQKTRAAQQAPTEVAVAQLGSDGQREPLRDDETTPAIVERAKEILDTHREAALGTEVPFEIDGRHYVGRIEQHYHEPGGSRRPWGWHRGVTVYHAD